MGSEAYYTAKANENRTRLLEERVVELERRVNNAYSLLEHQARLLERLAGIVAESGGRQ